MHEGTATSSQASAQGAPAALERTIGAPHQPATAPDRRFPSNKFRQLTGAQRVLLIRLYKQGRPTSEIARLVGCHENTIGRVIRAHDPTIVRRSKLQCHWPRTRKCMNGWKRYMRELVERGYRP